MNPDPIRTDARRVRKARPFGPDAACVLCGFANPTALIAVNRTLLEAHHVCGRANDDDLTVPLCRNCHAIVTEEQRTAGVDFAPPPTRLHQHSVALASLAVFFAALAKCYAEWAAKLSQLVVKLDREIPIWRTWSEAQPYGGAA